MTRTRLSRFSGLVVGALSIVITTALSAHVDDPKEKDDQPPYAGSGYRGALDAEPPIGFPAQGVRLEAWITLLEFDKTFTKGMDCWGYVSPSGREYAIIGMSGGTAFVEVTTPSDPQVIGIIYGSENGWRDIKTYLHYAYIVTEASDGGVQVVDMSAIDSGTITLVNTIFSGGVADTHNVAINQDTGYLYRAGGGNGLRFYDLNISATNPPFVGDWEDRYSHDVQVVTMTSGPFAGRELAFSCGGFSSGHVETGLDILDVTDKSNVTQVSRLLYPNGFYSHQGWLSPDRNYFYLNDEFDERDTGNNTTTHVIDVSDLVNPFEATTFSSGSTSIDHNLYTRDNLIFEANYRSGLRVFDATDPVAPVEIAYFDTYPEDDDANFNSLWSNYPYFPSGTVIGSDKEKGLFIWTVDALGGTPGDVNGDGEVTIEDLLLILVAWGDCPDPPEDCPEDLDGDGQIGFGDILVILSNWGA